MQLSLFCLSPHSPAICMLTSEPLLQARQQHNGRASLLERAKSSKVIDYTSEWLRNQSKVMGALRTKPHQNLHPQPVLLPHLSPLSMVSSSDSFHSAWTKEDTDAV